MAVWRRKRYEVVRNTTRPGFDAVDTGKRRLRFGRSGAFTVDDPGEAAEIQARYMKRSVGDVVVIETDHPQRGALWVVPEMPWKKRGNSV